MKTRLFICAVVPMLVVCFAAGAQSQTSPRMQAEALFVDAQKALSRGDTQTAESILKDALTKDPSFTSAIWQLAQIYESRERLDYARELYVRGLQQDPGASWARERLARIEGSLARATLDEARSFLNAGDYDRAIPKLSSYLGLKPQDATALTAMAKCQLAKGNMTTAREYVARAQAINPGNADAASLAAEIDKRTRSSRLEKALSNAQIALMDTTSAKNEKARAALQAVLDEDPANSWAKERLADLSQSAAAEAAREVQQEKAAPAAVAAEHGRKAIDGSVGALTATGRFVLAHLVVAILAVILCVLAIDIRRRMARRSYPLEGTITLIPILDIVSLINANLRTGRLIVGSSEASGEIFFEKGEIIHARCAGLNGKLAFHKLMDIRSGRFFFHNHLPNVRHTITEPLSLLLLSMKPNEDGGAEIDRGAGREEALTTHR
ncbi:MAG: tetratricopeptide repeat protein [Candidatus Krumholzibacteria bacterium]|nr:tetratricopeptide repeat protein [Candidatus Krumholzibacteria bacterium]